VRARQKNRQGAILPKRPAVIAQGRSSAGTIRMQNVVIKRRPTTRREKGIRPAGPRRER